MMDIIIIIFVVVFALLFFFSVILFNRFLDFVSLFIFYVFIFYIYIHLVHSHWYWKLMSLIGKAIPKMSDEVMASVTHIYPFSSAKKR